MIIELIRHGETELNAQTRYQGRTDAPLSEEGKRRLKRAPENPGHVYVSPLLRAGQTASLLFPDAEQIAVDGLAEMDFGVFDGRSFREMERDAQYRAWVDGMCLSKCPGGESRREFCGRTCAAFLEILEREKEILEEPGHADSGKEAGRIFIVAHGGTQMALLQCFGPRPGKGPAGRGGEEGDDGRGSAAESFGNTDEGGGAVNAGQRIEDSFEKESKEQDDYYRWQLPPGWGYVLEACGSAAEPVLRILEVRDFTREAGDG